MSDSQSVSSHASGFSSGSNNRARSPTERQRNRIARHHRQKIKGSRSTREEEEGCDFPLPVKDQFEFNEQVIAELEDNRPRYFKDELKDKYFDDFSYYEFGEPAPKYIPNALGRLRARVHKWKEWVLSILSYKL